MRLARIHMHSFPTTIGMDIDTRKAKRSSLQTYLSKADEEELVWVHRETRILLLGPVLSEPGMICVKGRLQAAIVGYVLAKGVHAVCLKRRINDITDTMDLIYFNFIGLFNIPLIIGKIPYYRKHAMSG